MRADAFLRGLEREMRRSVLPLWILEELGEGGPGYGYELMGRLARRGGPGFRVLPSILYPGLARLRGLGLVESFYGTESRGPVRKYYRLTDEGRRALRSAREVSDRLHRAGPEPRRVPVPSAPRGRPT